VNEVPAGKLALAGPAGVLVVGLKDTDEIGHAGAVIAIGGANRAAGVVWTTALPDPTEKIDNQVHGMRMKLSGPKVARAVNNSRPPPTNAPRTRRFRIAVKLASDRGHFAFARGFTCFGPRAIGGHRRFACGLIDDLLEPLEFQRRQHVS